ncbi:SRPBCC family protein [Nitrospira sp. M1]
MGNCYNSVIVNASCETVWKVLREFHDLSWAAGVVTQVEKVGEVDGDQVGAQRILNGAFHETLVLIDDRERTFMYRIDDGPGPVSKSAVNNYIGAARVLPITENDTAFVEWQSTYDSPNDTAVGELCNPIYQALLNSLKKHFS